MREETSLIYDWKETIPGVPITGGVLNNILLAKEMSTAIISKGK